MQSKGKMILIAFVGLTLMLVAFSPTLSARSGGVGSGTEEYNCGGASCHDVLGSVVLTMWASNLTPTVGNEVTVIVNVTGGQAVQSGIIGIMLVSSLSPDATSIPANAGWVIDQDPSQSSSTDNYYENYSYTGSGSFQWRLDAPAAPDVYRLYARAMHGGGDVYYEDYTSGLVFDVGATVTPGEPLVIISSVFPNQVLAGTVRVNVTVEANETFEYAVLKVNNTVIGNVTSMPVSFSLDTTKFVDGKYTLNVTVTFSDGTHGYRQITISIANSSSTTELVAWLWTLAAGSIAILAWIGIVIVIALMIRRRTVSRGGK